jgi:hypothetical protein
VPIQNLDEHQLELMQRFSKGNYAVLPMLNLSITVGFTKDCVHCMRTTAYVHKFKKQGKFFITSVQDMEQWSILAPADSDQCVGSLA